MHIITRVYASSKPMLDLALLVMNGSPDLTYPHIRVNWQWDQSVNIWVSCRKIQSGTPSRSAQSLYATHLSWSSALPWNSEHTQVQPLLHLISLSPIFPS